MIPALVELLQIGLLESLNEELRGPYALDGNALQLGDDLTLYRIDGPPTAIQAIGWGKLKSQR